MIKEIVIDAYNFAKVAHEGVYRKNSNLPYFVHPKMVARIVESYGGTPEMIAAALLHDTVEDTTVTFDDIRDRFGTVVAYLVYDVTNTDIRDNKDFYNNRVDYMIDKMLNMTADALTIKLSDRLNNVAWLDYDANTPDALLFARYYHDKTIKTLKGFMAMGPSLTNVHRELLTAIANELTRVDRFLNERGIV